MSVGGGEKSGWRTVRETLVFSSPTTPYLPFSPLSQAVKAALDDTGLTAGLASVGADAARAAANAAQAAGAQVMTAPNTNRPPTARESKAHKAADRAAAPIGTGAAQVLAVTGVQGGGSGVFGRMASAPGVEEVSDVSAPKGYVPPKYDGPAADAAWVASQKAQEAASGAGGGSNGPPNPLANQMNVAGSLPEPSNVNAVQGAVSFPGSGGAAAVKRSMYPTNDAGTGPAPVPGGGFSPIGGGSGFSTAPLSASNPGLAMPSSGGGVASVPPLPPPGGVSFAQQPAAAVVAQPAASSSSNGGGSLIQPPGARGAPALGVTDTLPTTTTVKGVGPGALPVTMTIG